MNPNAPHALYRFFDAQGTLLYVGITWDIATRFPKHQDEKPWWSQVKNITIEEFPDRQSVLAAEREAIQHEQPRYNVIHNRRSTPTRRETDEVDRYGRLLTSSDPAWRDLVRQAPELRTVCRWVDDLTKDYLTLVEHTGRRCANELWYGHNNADPAIRHVLGDMQGIKRLVEAVAGWHAGERIWPSRQPPQVITDLYAWTGEDAEAPGPQRVLTLTRASAIKPRSRREPLSLTWLPPNSIRYRSADGDLVRQIIVRGWDPLAVLRTREAYDAVYERLYALMPNCLRCSCWSSEEA